MKKKLKVVKLDEVAPTILPGEGIESRRVITKRRDNSERMSLSVVAIEKGYDGKTIYKERDEILYLLEGAGKISWKGGEAEVKPGTAIFIPAGTEYRYQVIEKNIQFGILSPPIE